ncbi:MAG: RNA polymerase sigma factor [Nanoarchaeota archaeon]|nr:RNA polymerase sigma factor [Nanoarchaeota archaeon]
MITEKREQVEASQQDYLINRALDLSKNIYKTAFRIVRNKADAEDITQETFIKIIRYSSSYDSNLSEPDTWIYTITKSCTLSYLRLLRAREKYKPKTIERLSEDPLSILIRKEEVDRISSLLDELDPMMRSLIITATEGIDYESLARVFNTKTITIKSRLHRGREQLRRKLEEDQKRVA